ncbi:Caspase-7 [Dermatophagoides pteronyssinus]|uniref:Caspase-7 n=1 Tax=Dermatophagoides pteronyssinus TaxID=6956 RepID=A0ABQ8IW94_DERPT|nr:Caspase-7 [Dermatophagoides pteronyssinus]
MELNNQKTDAPNNNLNNNNNNNNSTSTNEFDSGFFLNLCNISKIEENKLQPKQSIQISTKRDDLYYNMENKYNGRCIILNYETFDSEELSRRRGTEQDVKKLSQTFRQLNFNVEMFNDLTHHKTFEIFKRESMMDHTNYNCFVVCILTHGSNGILHTKDKKFDTNKMFEFFTGTHCPTLVGKPKLFFIQACQGEMFDSGVLVHDSPLSSPNYFMVPNYADFLIFYSTFPGHYSWRNVEHGSWFIQTLCDVLDEFSQKFDLMTLLTIVCQKVAINYQSKVPNNYSMDRKKQMPCIMSTLTRLIAF